MKRLLIAPILALTACGPDALPTVPIATLPGTSNLPLVRGYRDPADQCMLVGEDDYTNQYLGDASDLVGCPVGYEGTGVFITETGAAQVDTYQGYDLFVVARR
ncbi:hypothetical protein [Actibacterium lipolyticum]|uniref:Uncharacterized protein n=1 Tax=Actibacterium lipolyticum TaxID=1524263 RepID=A0A238JX36_9RHOB|nr:hypothetical protein [Actibacterium lipolyticum]SMX35210.1 hypothetical protein COL8621_01704 [Actibacterium lipolyticum]